MWKDDERPVAVVNWSTDSMSEGEGRSSSMHKACEFLIPLGTWIALTSIASSSVCFSGFGIEVDQATNHLQNLDRDTMTYESRWPEPMTVNLN